MASDKERKMFLACGIEQGPIDILENNDVIDLYRIAVTDCFLDDRRGPAVESLRRCYQAIQSRKMYREQPEFEALIELEDDTVKLR